MVHDPNLHTLVGHEARSHMASDQGVQIAHVAIGVFIGPSPETSADRIAPLYWELHTNRDEVERIFG